MLLYKRVSVPPQAPFTEVPKRIDRIVLGNDPSDALTVFSPRIENLSGDEQVKFLKNVCLNLGWYNAKGITILSISSKEATPTDSKMFCHESARRRIRLCGDELRVGTPVSQELKLIFFRLNGERIAVGLFGDHTVDMHALKMRIKETLKVEGHLDLKSSVDVIRGANNPASFFMAWPEGKFFLDTRIVTGACKSLWTNLGTNPTCSSAELERHSLVVGLAKLDNVYFGNFSKPPKQL